MILNPGLHYDIPASVYHADPTELSLSRSLASVLLRQTPEHAHYLHPKLGGHSKESTRKIDFGSICHAFMLGEEGRVEIADHPTFQSKDAKEWRASVLSVDKVPCLKVDAIQALALKMSARARLEKMGYLATIDRAKKEVTSIFDHEGVLCRCRLDALDIDMEFRQGTIYDYKITTSAKPETLERQIGDMNYDLQGAWYKKSVAKHHPEISGRLKFILVFIEDEPPYVTTPVELSEAYLQIGQLKMDRAVETWKRCVAGKSWPSYVEKLHRASPPEWLSGRVARGDL